jgi:hypothetical protein
MRGSFGKWAGGLAIGIGTALLAILFCGRVPTQEFGAPDKRVEATSEPRQALEPRSNRAGGEPAAAPAPGPTGSSPAGSTEPPPRAQPAAISESGDERGKRRLDEALLVERGLRDGDIAWLSEHFDAAEHERKRLRAAAKEEDRHLTREEHRRIWEFETQLAREIGSDNYDRLLYAAGDFNRVRVRTAHFGSRAEAAGFEVGDFIVSYDGIPTFRVEHVRDLLVNTESETSVQVEVKRGGEIFELTLSTGSAPKPPRGRIFGLFVVRDREAP